jgi:nucleotide-binding universal stress UspA family protein
VQRIGDFRQVEMTLIKIILRGCTRMRGEVYAASERQMKHIMIATDFSERSDRALRRATLLAKQFGASLSIVHVVDDDRPQRMLVKERDLASQLLEEIGASVRGHDGVTCETRVVLGASFNGILKAVEDGCPDLLVIGSHRRQELRDVFTGTTAERTIRSASCPVLMANAPPAGAYRKILLTTDFSDEARRAVDAFVALEMGQGSEINLLHLFDVTALRLAMAGSMTESSRIAYLEAVREEASRELASFAQAAALENAKQIARGLQTSAALDIIKIARETSTDLIVVGTRGRSGLGKFLLGSVAEEVLRGADRDVLAVPPGKRAAATR